MCRIIQVRQVIEKSSDKTWFTGGGNGKSLYYFCNDNPWTVVVVKLFSRVQLLWPRRLQDVRLSCPSSSPRACSDTCPLSWWCHPNMSSSVVSSYFQSFPATEYFPKSPVFAPGGQNIGVSALASVLQMNIQDQIPEWTRMDWLALLAVQGTLKSLSNITVQKHQFFGAQLSL